MRYRHSPVATARRLMVTAARPVARTRRSARGGSRPFADRIGAAAAAASIAALLLTGAITARGDRGFGEPPSRSDFDAALETRARVDPAVISVVAESGRAAVIVSLAPASVHDWIALAETSGVDGSALEAAVAAAQDRLLSAVAAEDFRVTHRYARIPALAGRVSARGLGALADNSVVRAVALDPVLQAHLSESGPYIGADKVQRQGFTGEGVRVAVMDTGIDTGNLDLRDGIVEERCFIDPARLCPPPPHVAEDSDGHGTNVSGIVASRGRRSAKGVAPAAEIVAVKLLEERNNAAGSATLAAFDWAAGRDDLHVVNMSFGGGGYEGACDDYDAYTQALAAAVTAMRARGIVPVASSGNDGSPTKMAAPACITGVLSVGAMQGFEPGADPQLAQFTNRNDRLDVLAPGVGVVTTGLSGRLVEFGGTSAAAPHVAGAVALLRQAVPWAGPEAIEAAIKATGGRPTLRYGQVTISTVRVDLALRELQRRTPTASAGPPVATSPTPTVFASATASPTASSTPPATPEPTVTGGPSVAPSATRTPTSAATGQVPSPTATAPPTGTARPTLPAAEGRLYLPSASLPGALPQGARSAASSMAGASTMHPVMPMGPAQSPGAGWAFTGQLSTGRSEHTTSLLHDGRLLTAGGLGADGVLASTERYDPGTGSWTAAAPMAIARQQHAAVALAEGRVLVVGGLGAGDVFLASAELFDPVADAWWPTGEPAVGRRWHTATRLVDGRVLVVGGAALGERAVASAELYDPSSGTWAAAAAMAAARALHSATLLADGRVLVIGGQPDAAAPGAELYDPARDAWSAAPGPATLRSRHTATRLSDDRVLVAGGVDAGGATLHSAEMYDPATRSWSAVGAMSTPRARHTATLLVEGAVLVAGGEGDGGYASAERFDARSGTWGPYGRLSVDHARHTATLLAGGQVVVVGGLSRRGGAEHRCERLDPAGARWMPTADMASPRQRHSATLLADGRVLVVGGEGELGALSAQPEIYDPTVAAWKGTGTFALRRFYHSATLLRDGSVLVAGGEGREGVLSSAERYDPATDTWETLQDMHDARAGHTATLLPDGRVMVAGGYGDRGDLALVEWFDPASGQWARGTPMSGPRMRHTATLLGDGRVLVVGGEARGNVLAGAEVFDGRTDRWTPVAAPSGPRVLHTATLVPGGTVLVAGGTDDGFNSVATAERYDPAADAWEAVPAMRSPRMDHDAVLLPDGGVLVVGGWDSRAVTGEDGWLRATERFDPATGRWTAEPALTVGRVGARVTALLDALLVTGGYGSEGVLSVAERLDWSADFDPRRRPVIDEVVKPVRVGQRLLVKGSGFARASGASGGNGGQDSSTNHPLVRITSLESGETRFLWPDDGEPWTDARFSSRPLEGFASGSARIVVVVGGVPSEAALVAVEVPQATASVTVEAPTSTAGAPATPTRTPATATAHVFMPLAKRGR